jgi:hypothetical protein
MLRSSLSQLCRVNGGGFMMYDRRQFKFRTECLAAQHLELIEVRKQKEST